MENWKVIEKFPDYECSDLGNFRRCTPGKGTIIGKPRRTYQNPVTKYLNVTFSYRGQKCTRTYAAHRVIAETWIPNPNNLPQVNHIDKDRTNNKVSNLEWISVKDNNKGTELIATNLETGWTMYFSAISEAQRECHVSHYKIKQVMDGKIPHWRGWHFKKISDN